MGYEVVKKQKPSTRPSRAVIRLEHTRPLGKSVAGVLRGLDTVTTHVQNSTTSAQLYVFVVLNALVPINRKYNEGCTLHSRISWTRILYDCCSASLRLKFSDL